ncbi:MAG: hypothetical protein E6Q33_06335 [Neisseriales bacterium]|nr:MAG: hypothetical protein E6Q33_06335 [Neisseriales bacterium]
MPVMYVYLESQTFIIDDSIMPWRNNITHILPAWFGKVTADDYSEEGLITSGVGSFLATLPMKTVIFREYKKLDWLLGMLGGGFFLLYVFFYVPFSYFSAKKNEKKVC